VPLVVVVAGVDVGVAVAWRLVDVLVDVDETPVAAAVVVVAVVTAAVVTSLVPPE
jgi:hypothetical protein